MIDLYGARFDWTERGTVVTLWGTMRGGYRLRLAWAVFTGNTWRAYRDNTDHTPLHLGSVSADDMRTPDAVTEWLGSLA